LAAGSAVSPEGTAEGNVLRAAVQDAIASLSLKHRATVVLFYLQGFSLPEIAYILDCPVGTFKSRFHYACRALRKNLSADRRLAGEVAYGAP
jgi:RNA polymerase sigma-70 factor (ECF subfamily)